MGKRVPQVATQLLQASMRRCCVRLFSRWSAKRSSSPPTMNTHSLIWALGGIERSGHHVMNRNWCLIKACRVISTGGCSDEICSTVKTSFDSLLGDDAGFSYDHSSSLDLIFIFILFYWSARVPDISYVYLIVLGESYFWYNWLIVFCVYKQIELIA